MICYGLWLSMIYFMIFGIDYVWFWAKSCCWLLCACWNLLWLHDFHWLPSTCPNAMKFDMLTMLDVRIECELSDDFWKYLGWLLMQVILLTSLSLHLPYFDFKCSWNDDSDWYACEPNWNCFLIDWIWFWLSMVCCFDFFILFWP
jgi:hypothetical protein